MMDVKKYFHDMRFDKRHHLGLGDIRLTIAQQHEIVEYTEQLEVKLKAIECAECEKTLLDCRCDDG